ncbi:TerD family protein [Streptomyces sp. NPDC057654]|uniref:TerD family protein n=1 Tax=Streptomyces sp. NPDC057654 TaxID=3346196 RepID=UPI0036A15C03
MTAELVRGQNHPLPQTRLEIRVSAGGPVVAGAVLGDERGRAADAGWVAHPAAPHLPGLEVSQQAAADHRLAVDLDALPAAAHRVSVLLALPSGAGGPARFGAMAAPFVAVTGLDGTEVAGYTITDLDSESAVVALELYRRQGAWKVRAVGQGYAGGLAAMLHDQGLPGAAELAAVIEAAVDQGAARSITPPPRPARNRDKGERARYPDGKNESTEPPAAPGSGPIDYRHPRRRPAKPAQGAPTSRPPVPPPVLPSQPGPAAQPGAEERPPAPVAGDAGGWTMDERLYNQVWGMFEDLARTVSAYRSAVDFAESRMERELDEILSDPGTRVGPAADAAREAARRKQTGLVAQARAVLDRDLGRLAAESDVVEHALPPAYARWDSPVWQGYQVPFESPMALRLGDLRLPERDDLRIPMLMRLPLERGLWIDSGRTGAPEAALMASADVRRLAMDTAVAHAARLLAVHPVGDFAVQVIDPAGAAGASLAPLLRSGALREPPAAGARGVAETLTRLTRRVDLVQMAVRSGAVDSLPRDLDTADQMLIVNDFPHGFDDRAVNQLRYLADEGPSVGVHLMMVADRQDAREYGPVLDPLWRALLRLTPVPDDHLADPWVGHAWTYEPPAVPRGSEVLGQVIRQVGQALQAHRR